MNKRNNKLCTFLRQVKYILSAGAEVICAETVMNPVQLYNAEQIPEMEDELKFLFTLRSVHPLNLFSIKMQYCYEFQLSDLSADI